MGYVRTSKFSFCVPVRFGVLIMSTLSLFGGMIIATLGWYGAVHKQQTYLTKNQEISVVVASVSYTILAVVSFFGLIGTIIKRRAFVSMYSSIVSLHLGSSVATGAYFIYTLFHKVGEDDVNNCIADNASFSTERVDDCKRAFKYIRGMIVGIFIIFWLFELWCCIVVADYVSELNEEDVPDYPPPAEITARAPPLATTYNFVGHYGFSAPENSFGQRNAANV